VANITINGAMTPYQTFFMLALDMRNAFGSVSYVQLRKNLSQLGLHPQLSEVILDSDTDAKVRVITLNGAT
jgi:hypothetical protein